MEWKRSTEVTLGQIFPPRKDDDLDWYIDSEQVRSFHVMEQDRKQWDRGNESDLQNALNRAEALLRSIIDADLRPVAVRQSTLSNTHVVESSDVRTSVPTNDFSHVFIVHGRDEATKNAVARFVEQLGLKPIILEERPSKGKTMIEKVEANAEVSYAIVLMTADDTGAFEEEDPEPRARQNVIFELGFFVGHLGRERVCMLKKGNPQMPSNYYGVNFIDMDGQWKWSLARELKDARLEVDERRAFD